MAQRESAGTSPRLGIPRPSKSRRNSKHSFAPAWMSRMLSVPKKSYVSRTVLRARGFGRALSHPMRPKSSIGIMLSTSSAETDRAPTIESQSN